jgi:hypothetical protein
MLQASDWMRVTLRTLIAGQCGLLNPHQKATLDEQLRQHAAARLLYEHLTDLRLSKTPRTPPLSGTGLGIDPASVAGYLQRRLPADQAQAFERIAIESDQALDELMAMAAINDQLSGLHGLTSDRIERVLTIGMDGVQLDGTRSLKVKGVQVASAEINVPNHTQAPAPIPSVAMATSGKSSYRRYGFLASLTVSAAVAFAILSIGSRSVPDRSAPDVEELVVAATSREDIKTDEGEWAIPSEPEVVNSLPEDRSVMAASWEVALTEPQLLPPKRLELGAKEDRQSDDRQEVQLQADRRIAMGDLSVVAGSDNLLGDPNHADSWNRWIDWVAGRCRDDSVWQERLELEIAGRPASWQPVLKLLWQGVPQAGSDPVWRRWLLDALVHEQLEIRVLASYQYARLTGMVPLVVDRAQAIASLSRWEERLTPVDGNR